MDEILWCDRLNEISFGLLSQNTIYFAGLKKKMKLGIFLEFFLWPLLGVKGYSEHLSYIEHALVPLTQRMIE